MNLRNIGRVIIVSMITFLLILISSEFCYSNAVAIGFLGFNNAPRKYLTVDKEKLADVTIRMADNNQIASVQLYSVNSKGEKKKINFSSSNTDDNKNQIYTLSHSKLLKGEEKQFYVVVKDKTGNVQKSYFQIRVRSKKVNGKTVKYYAVNDSPRVINPTAGGNKMTLGIKDNGGTKYTKIQDANNENKEIYKFTELEAGEQKVAIDLTKFKKVDEVYKFRVLTEDHTGQKAIRTMYFKVDPNAAELKLTTDQTTQKTEKSKDNTKGKNVSSFVAALERMSQRAQADYKAKKYWKYTNGIHSENRLPMKKTFQSSLDSGLRTTNCSSYVAWGLHECGILTANQKFYGNSSGGITWCKNSKTKVKSAIKKYATITRIGGAKRPKTLVREGKLKKGDILTYKLHVNAYAGNGKWYDAGRRKRQNGRGTSSNYTFKTWGPIKITYNHPVYYIIRLKDQS